MNLNSESSHAGEIGSKAAGVESVFDVFDVVFDLVDIFLAILDAIRDFGNFQNGN